MKKSRQFMLALLLLLPALSWICSSGGVPVCCWGGFCPMMAQTGEHCSMMPGGQQCAMSDGHQLALPASAIPLVPIPHRITGIPLLDFLNPTLPEPQRELAAGWALCVFHPPQA